MFSLKTTIIFLAIAGLANAECPNACSGHGRCEAYDMCTCDRMWQAADCSERQCAFGYSFVTTPQGDLNMDGDREDNSYKPLSEPGQITINTNTITFARSGLQKNELKVGDGIRICNENFIVTQLRGRIVVNADDYITPAQTDDTTHEITSATEDDYRRRIKEVVLNTRHTQNCGTDLTAGGRNNGVISATGTGIVKGARKAAKFTTAADQSANVLAGDQVLIYCTDVGSAYYYSDTGNNKYGFLEDGTYNQYSRIMTVHSHSSNDIIFNEPLPDTVASANCKLVPINDVTVYRQLTTQSRPNGDWEKWKGDFKGTGTKPGRGPTMNELDSEYLRLGKDYYNGNAAALGDYAQDEGHFYMECSNQGLCDRKSGLCECFDGYSGRACQRQACPEDCSGHGVCLTVDQLRRHEMTKLPFTCQTVRNDKTVVCDSNLWESKMRPGDYVKIGDYPPMKIASITGADDTGSNINYNITHFLSTSDTHKADTFELVNDFPETLTYGTEVWQVHDYRLWDAHKNRACKCDPQFTGFDCSERKCPHGDDPLTVDTVDPQRSSTTTDDSSYNQQPERQTLYIDSDEQNVVGSISLAFEDYFGEVFQTKNIPLEVELSVTVKISSGSTTVTFDGAEGLPSTELTRGDQIRVGREIRFVETITYKDHNTKTHIASFVVRDGYMGAEATTEQFSLAHPTGSRIYRQDVSKEIREALLAVPNSRIEGVSVEKVEMSGNYEMDMTGTNSATLTGTGSHDKVVVGDVVRYKSQLRIVTAETTDTVTVLGKVRTSDAASPVYLANTQRYRIRFESGCMTNDHCNHNGINSYDSDEGATCSLGGACVCSLPSGTSLYHGFGCTRKGKGNDFHGVPRIINHARPYKRSNSGDLPLLQCDKNSLFSGRIMSQYGSVSKATPTKITFAAGTANAEIAVGDDVYVDGQVRTVVQSQGATATWVKVDRPFTIYAKSDDDSIVPIGSTVYRVDRLGGVNTKCHATDMPMLTDAQAAWDAGTGTLATVSASSTADNVAVDGNEALSSQTNPHSEITIAPHDPQEVEIGDRIRVDTGSSAGTGHLTDGTYMTHTVDRIDYSTAGQISKISLNEIVSHEDTTTGTFKTMTGATKIYNDQRGTTENKECSGRGLCDSSTGTCECFKGYTDDDCSRQNALASA